MVQIHQIRSRVKSMIVIWVKSSKSSLSDFHLGEKWSKPCKFSLNEIHDGYIGQNHQIQL